ncbi:hypothetical protein K3217_11410 [bacterium BD-1]|nr:hypothetical protein [Ottowia caeni]
MRHQSGFNGLHIKPILGHLHALNFAYSLSQPSPQPKANGSTHYGAGRHHRLSSTEDRYEMAGPICRAPRCRTHLLRMHHERIEASILEQAGILFDADAAPGALRAVGAASNNATTNNP